MTGPDPAAEQAAAAEREAARAAGEGTPLPPQVLAEIVSVSAGMVERGAVWADVARYIDVRVQRHGAEEREVARRLAALEHGFGGAPGVLTGAS